MTDPTQPTPLSVETEQAIRERAEGVRTEQAQLDELNAQYQAWKDSGQPSGVRIGVLLDRIEALVDDSCLDMLPDIDALLAAVSTLRDQLAASEARAAKAEADVQWWNDWYDEAMPVLVAQVDATREVAQAAVKAGIIDAAVLTEFEDATAPLAVLRGAIDKADGRVEAVRTAADATGDED